MKKTEQTDRLDAEERRELKNSDFGVPESMAPAHRGRYSDGREATEQ